MFEITSGKPTVEESRAIERAFAIVEAEQRAIQADRRQGCDAWTLSGRLAAHGAAAGLALMRA